jgi:hypothetical protein
LTAARLELQELLLPVKDPPIEHSTSERNTGLRASWPQIASYFENIKNVEGFTMYGVP